jgi:hypothetical protein
MKVRYKTNNIQSYINTNDKLEPGHHRGSNKEFNQNIKNDESSISMKELESIAEAK